MAQLIVAMEEDTRLDEAAMLEEWTRLLRLASSTRRERARRRQEPLLEPSPLLLDMCQRPHEGSGEAGFLMLLPNALVGCGRGRGGRRHRSMRRTLLMRCLFAMPEETALDILDHRPGTGHCPSTRWSVGRVLPRLHPHQAATQMESITRNGDIAMGRLFTARDHWLGVDGHGRHRGLVALLQSSIGSECWRLVTDKAIREGVMEMMRCNVAFALSELRGAPASAIAEIAQYLQLEECHLKMLHPISGRSLLHKPSSVEDLQFLLDNGLKEYLNKACRSGLTPLDYWLAKPAGVPQLEALVLLLRNGAVPDYANSSKRCNAVQAASKDEITLEVLLRFGADVTRLHGSKSCLTYWERLYTEQIEWILATGFPREAITGKLLFDAFRRGVRHSPALERKVDILLANGADLHYREASTLLLVAPAPLVDRLIRAGLDINGTPSLLFKVAHDPSRCSPLLFSEHACRVPGNIIAFGGSVLASPLARAARWGNCYLVQALLEYGVDVGKDHGDVEPLVLAVCYDYDRAAQLLLRHGAAIPQLSEVQLLAEPSSPELLCYKRFLETMVGRNTKRA